MPLNNSGGLFYFSRSTVRGSVFAEHYDQFVDAVEASEIAAALFGVPFRVRHMVNSGKVFGGPVWAAAREELAQPFRG